MGEMAKYLVWLGLFLAAIGYVVGAYMTYVALAELVMGIAIGVLTVQKDVKGIGDRAVTYSILSIATAQFPAPTYATEMVAWMKTYFILMAMMYVPAALITYLAKTVKEGI